MKPLLPLVARWILAIPLLVFGVNKLAHLFSMPPPPGDTARAFLDTMFESYLITLVSVTEMTGALLLTRARTALVGALLLLPVTVNIVVFHAAHDLQGIGPGLLCFLANGYLLVRARARLATLLGPDPSEHERTDGAQTLS